MTGWPEPLPRCPSCRLAGPHMLVHRPSPPGAFATWPDELAPCWERTCCYCGHEWREPA